MRSTLFKCADMEVDRMYIIDQKELSNPIQLLHRVLPDPGMPDPQKPGI